MHVWTTIPKLRDILSLNTHVAAGTTAVKLDVFPLWWLLYTRFISFIYRKRRYNVVSSDREKADRAVRFSTGIVAEFGRAQGRRTRFRSCLYVLIRMYLCDVYTCRTYYYYYYYNVTQEVGAKGSVLISGLLLAVKVVRSPWLSVTIAVCSGWTNNIMLLNTARRNTIVKTIPSNAVTNRHR